MQKQLIVLFYTVSEIKNFLSDDECDAIIELAKEKGMKKAAITVKDLNLPNGNSHLVFDKWDKNLDGSLSIEEVFKSNANQTSL